MTKKILITGGSGFIGSHLANKLLSFGHDITIFDINPPQSAHKFIQGSITSQADINHAMKGITHVFHLAALSNIKTITNPIQALEVNTVAGWIPVRVKHFFLRTQPQQHDRLVRRIKLGIWILAAAAAVMLAGGFVHELERLLNGCSLPG